MNSINNKKTANKINKERIIFIISVIFFITSVLAKIYNTCMLLKENDERKIKLNNPNKQIFEKEIKKRTEKINYILGISDTLGVALNYIKKNYKDNTNMQVKIILNDSMVGINSISSALETMYSDLDNKNIKLETNNLGYLFNELMQALDENKIKMVENIMNSILINEYNHWKSDIENEFR